MTNDEYARLKYDIGSISPSTIKDLESDVRCYLDRCGLFYKSFRRIKQPQSIKEKIENRKKEGRDNYVLQDLVGIRIVVYFKSDIELCEKIIQQHFHVLDISKDVEETDKFKPLRINYVCELPDKIERLFDDKIWTYPIDKSFEILK